MLDILNKKVVCVVTRIFLSPASYVLTLSPPHSNHWRALDPTGTAISEDKIHSNQIGSSAWDNQ